MNVTINIDCTPEEARAFFGLPDLRPLHETVLNDMQGRMSAGLAAMDPDAMLKAWMPGGVASMEQLQKMFWGAMVPPMTGDKEK